MELSDMVLAIDKQQLGPHGIDCPRDPKHGRMQTMKSATALICCLCEAKEPVSIIGDPD